MTNYTVNDPTGVIDAVKQQSVRVATNLANWSAEATLDAARHVVQAATKATS